MSSCKIVFTGGPCGGKTESIDLFASRLIAIGKKVAIANETAQSLLSLDYMPNNNISSFDFQNLLFKIQFIKEYQCEKKADIVLCDRGLFDGKVYMNHEEFDKMLHLNKVMNNELLSTYDLALYFRSIAYEYPNEFHLQRIYETPEIGIERDKRSLEIWREKLLSLKCDNLHGFKNKQESLYIELLEFLSNFNLSTTHQLSEFYNDEYIAFFKKGIDEIMNQYDFSEEVKIKTRGLVK